MIIAYDQEARSRQAFIDEARKKEEEEKRQVAERMANLVAELDAANRSSDDSFRHLQSVLLLKKKDEEKLAELEAEVSGLRLDRDKDLKALKLQCDQEKETAVSAARRDAAAEVRAQLNKAYDLYEKLLRKPMKHMVYFSQAEANLQLLDDIEAADAENPFDPIAERAEIAESKAKFGPGNESFDVIAAELRKTLGTDYVVPVRLGDIVFSPCLETVAKSIGINVASGSNDGSLGMRLRGASEELNDSDDSHGGEPEEADEAATRGEEVVVAASSTAPTVQAEDEGKEDGEL